MRTNKVLFRKLDSFGNQQICFHDKHADSDSQQVDCVERSVVYGNQHFNANIGW